MNVLFNMDVNSPVVVMYICCQFVLRYILTSTSCLHLLPFAVGNNFVSAYICPCIEISVVFENI